MRRAILTALTLCLTALGACTALSDKNAPTPAVSQTNVVDAPGTVHPEMWPVGHSGVVRDPLIEARVAELLSQMTLEEKVGQTIQADIAYVSPKDVRQYHLGSILDGGSSGPYGNDRALAPLWLKAADEFYAASLPATADRPKIPLIWGSDSVHGNSNIIGATIFPHNIGLGAARDPDLLRSIGEITAIESRVVGADWTFAPTLAVVRDDRWGRTYEGYSEEPELVRSYASAIVEGIQGKPGATDFLRDGHIIATAKHFLGDGGTDKGRDQGDTRVSETDLRDLFAPGYEAAIASGVQSVMASFSSWQGQKVTGNKALLTDVLVGRLGFDGFVVSDWNAHSQVPGCTTTSCVAAYNAGIDMIMAPDSWRGLYSHTLAQARSGEISPARLNEAVSRILRVKLRAGVMDEGPPSTRPYGGKWDELGSPSHRAVARRAVRESLVLLKNDKGLLPLMPSMHLLVAGDGADNLPKQCGGWTISWQGNGNTRSDFPRGQTIFEGIREQAEAGGGEATLSVDGSFSKKPDAAIVVFGEDPYAETAGDRDDLAFDGDNARDLRLMRRLRAQGIAVVGIILSGRPLYVTPEINASDAFIASWLPGSEGGGLADLLFRKPDGTIQYDFRGKLSFSWPRGPNQSPLNVPRPGEAAASGYDPLFAYGYGQDYAHPQDLGLLPEAPDGDVASRPSGEFLRAGHAIAPWTLILRSRSGAAIVADDMPAALADGGLRLSRADRNRQEDTLVAQWGGAARLAIEGPPIDLSRWRDASLRFDVRLDTAPPGPVLLVMACGASCRGVVDIGARLKAAAGWHTISIPLACFATAGLQLNHVTTAFEIDSTAPAALALGDITLAPPEGVTGCPVAPSA